MADLTRYDNHDARLSECFVCRRSRSQFCVSPSPTIDRSRHIFILFRSRRFTFFLFFSFPSLSSLPYPVVVPPRDRPAQYSAHKQIFLPFFYFFFQSRDLPRRLSLSFSHTLTLSLSLSLSLSRDPSDKKKQNTPNLLPSVSKEKKKERKERQNDTREKKRKKRNVEQRVEIR